MHATELEKIAALPLVQDAIRAQAEAIEAEALAARIATLDAYQQACDELESLDGVRRELEGMQDELSRQRDELGRKFAACTAAMQGAKQRQRAHTLALYRDHGGQQAVTIGRMLAAHATALRREAEYQRARRDLKTHWTGKVTEVPTASAIEKAVELECRAEQLTRESDAIMALQFSRISPQAIERDIQARVNALGFRLNITEADPEGWRIEKWQAVKVKGGAA